MRHFVISAFIAAALPLSAVAQDAPDTSTPDAGATTTTEEVTNGQAFGDWKVRCEALGVNRTRCMLSQQISIRESGAVLAELLAFWTDDDPQPILIAQVPVGAHLPSGFVLQPEAAPEEDRVEFTWQACSARICEAVALPGQEVIVEMAGADSLVAGYRPAVGGEAVFFPVSFNGLTDGLAALKPKAAD